VLDLALHPIAGSLAMFHMAAVALLCVCARAHARVCARARVCVRACVRECLPTYVWVNIYYGLHLALTFLYFFYFKLYLSWVCMEQTIRLYSEAASC